MIDVDASGSLLTESIARKSLSEMKQDRKQDNFLPEKAFLHPIQLLSIVQISFSSVVVGTDVPEKIPDHPTTLAGIPVVQVPDMDQSTIEFRDLDGKICGRIKNLGIPVT